jgi:hypothetical protein
MPSRSRRSHHNRGHNVGRQCTAVELPRDVRVHSAAALDLRAMVDTDLEDLGHLTMESRP